jgi:hypothetical protein
MAQRSVEQSPLLPHISSAVAGFHTSKHPQVAAEPLMELHAFANSGSLDLNARLNKHQLQVTAVCWSPSGATLAVAFGR